MDNLRPQIALRLVTRWRAGPASLLARFDICEDFFAVLAFQDLDVILESFLDFSFEIGNLCCRLKARLRCDALFLRLTHLLLQISDLIPQVKVHLRLSTQSFVRSFHFVLKDAQLLLLPERGIRLSLGLQKPLNFLNRVVGESGLASLGAELHQEFRTLILHCFDHLTCRLVSLALEGLRCQHALFLVLQELDVVMAASELLLRLCEYGFQPLDVLVALAQILECLPQMLLRRIRFDWDS